MPRILKRPMFRSGGSTNEGIMHGLVDRKGYKHGSEAERYRDEYMEMLAGVQPPAPRFNMGQMGLNLISGEYAGDGLLQNIAGSAQDPYTAFTKADDISRNLDYQTQMAAAKYGMSKADAEALVKAKALAAKKKGFRILSAEEAKSALGVGYDSSKTYQRNLDTNQVSQVTGTGVSDERTRLMKELEAAGILPGSDEYKEAMRAFIFKESKTTAERNALALGLTPGTEEYNDYIKGATIRTDAAADRALQGTGIVLGKTARDKLVQNTMFVETIQGNLNDIDDMLAVDKNLGGLSGSIKRIGFKIASAAEGIGIPVKELLPENWETAVFDNDAARLEALETVLAPGFARVIFPNQRMTNFLIQEAKDKIRLTGLTGTEEVRARLAEIKTQFDNYLENNQKLLGNQPTLVQEGEIGKTFIIVDGKLVEKK